MNLDDLDRHLGNLQTGLRTLRILTYHEHNVEQAIENLFKSWNTFLVNLDHILYPERTVVLPITAEVERVALSKLGRPNEAIWEQIAEVFYGRAPRNCLIERRNEPIWAVFIFDSKDEALKFKLRWGQ